MINRKSLIKSGSIRSMRGSMRNLNRSNRSSAGYADFNDMQKIFRRPKSKSRYLAKNVYTKRAPIVMMPYVYPGAIKCFISCGSPKKPRLLLSNVNATHKLIK